MTLLIRRLSGAICLIHQQPISAQKTPIAPPMVAETTTTCQSSVQAGLHTAVAYHRVLQSRLPVSTSDSLTLGHPTYRIQVSSLKLYCVETSLWSIQAVYLACSLHSLHWSSMSASKRIVSSIGSMIPPRTSTSPLSMATTKKSKTRFERSRMVKSGQT